MNTPAVLLGFLYGFLSIGLCYGISMVTSGLFVRPYYRLYARTLIGTCSVMLIAPGLRLLATYNPELATIALTGSQYIVIGILGYGIVQFNRNYLCKVYQERATAAYFAFGTLANAAIVTLGFLHVAVTATPAWKEHNIGFVSAGNYGPILLLLAGLVFHTDIHLKKINNLARNFSRFTFLGYAISFLGIALSILPSIATTFGNIELVTHDSPLLKNFFSMQAFMFAMLLYGYLVWKYESIPPLYLFLFALIGEYHLVVTQWTVAQFGIASLAFASLPLCVGLYSLEYYFSTRNARKRKECRVTQHALGETSNQSFSQPFRVVGVFIASGLFAASLWSRSIGSDASSHIWLVLTFSTYSLFAFTIAGLRKQPHWIYVAGTLLGLAGFAGTHEAFNSVATMATGAVSLTFVLLSVAVRRLRSQQAWQTPFADCGLLIAVCVACVASSRHLLSDSPYLFAMVDQADAMALSLTSIVFLISAYLYRSWLPVFASLLAISLIAPPWAAVVSLAGAFSAFVLKNNFRKEEKLPEETQLKLFGIEPLAFTDQFPSVYYHPLAIASIALALTGLAIATYRVVSGDFQFITLFGVTASASSLLLLTLQSRNRWLYITAILSSYFAVNVVAHGVVFEHWSATDAYAAHLLLTAIVSLANWGVALSIQRMSATWSPRVREKVASKLHTASEFYAENLLKVVTAIATALLALVACRSVSGEFTDIATLATSSITTVLFAWATYYYRSQYWSYLTLASISLVAVSLSSVLRVPHWAGTSAIAALLFALCNFILFGIRSSKSNADDRRNSISNQMGNLAHSDGINLWLAPTACFAVACAAIALVQTVSFHSANPFNFQIANATPIVCLLVGVTLLLLTRSIRNILIYLSGLAFVFLSAQSAVQLAFGDATLTTIPITAHLFAASLQLGTTCLIATLITEQLNSRIKDPPLRVITGACEFYAGMMVHAAFGTSLLLLFAYATQELQNGAVSNIGVRLAIGLLLGGTFSWLAVLYRSRIPVYCALLTSCVMLVISVKLLPSDLSELAITVLTSASAFTLGISAWVIKRFDVASTPGKALQDASLACWRRPPLPLFSPNRSLWSIPLAHASVGLCIACLALLVTHWIQFSVSSSTIVLSAIAVYLVSIALLVATRTHTFGWGRLFASQDGGVSLAIQNAMIERGILYAAAILLAGIGTHLLLDATAWHDLIRLRIAKHFLLGSTLILFSWFIAMMIMRWLDHREDAAPESSRDAITQDRWLYAGLLHHIALTLSVIASVCYVPAMIRSGFPIEFSMLGLGLLATYFCLAGASYRSRIPIYFAIGTLLAMLVQTVVFSRPWLPAIDTIALPLLTLLGLAFASPAIAIDFSRGTSMLRSPLTLFSPMGSRRTASLHSLWVSPLRNTATLIACVSLAGVLFSLNRDTLGSDPTALLASLLGITATALILAKLYRSPTVSYVAITILMISCIPILQLGGETLVHLGSVLALLAMLLWIGGFLIERFGVRGQECEREVSQTSALELYGQPLIRSSAIFACIAIIHGLWIWYSQGFQSSQTSIVITTAIGSLTLMLNARSMTHLHKIAWARVLVYLACLSVTGCWLASYSMTWQTLTGLGPNAAFTSLVLGLVGCLLIESARNATGTNQEKAETRLTFGEPISHFASCLSVASVILAVVAFAEQRAWITIGIQTATDSVGTLGILGLTLLIASGTCLVSVRAQATSHWLYAFSLLGSCGLIAILQDQMSWMPETLLVNWMLLMVGLAAASRIASQGRVSQMFLSLPKREISLPLLAWPAISSFAVLAVQMGCVVSIAFFGVDAPNYPWIPVSMLCGVVFFQAAYLHRSAIWLHAIVASVTTGLLGWSLQDASPISPGLALAITGTCLVLLATGWRLAVGKQILDWLALESSKTIREDHQRDFLAWGAFLLVASLPTSILLAMGDHATLTSLSLVVYSITFSALISSLRWKYVPASAIALTGALASVGTTMVVCGWQNLLVANAALGSAIFALGYLGLAACLTRMSKQTQSLETSKYGRFLIGTGKTALFMSYGLAGTALLISAISILRSFEPMSTSIALAAATTHLLLVAFVTKHKSFAYAGLSCVLVTVASTFYLAIEIPVERSAGASFFVVGYSLLLYLINIIATRAVQPGLRVFRIPSYYLALAIPVLLAFTLPIDQSALASFTLLATGAFYLTVAFEARVQWPLYVAAFLFNVAVYLWVPAANQLTGLYQLYVIPAAATVLVFAQLHHRELNHSILTSIRLAASGTILAVSTFEVFLSEETTLLQFVSVLLLSLAGTALGIALRVKPFVYVGIAFLILNVIGQLGVQFHDEGGIIRALILIGVGIAVLGIMIFFNIHRERILRQYRGFLVDESWE